MSITAAGASAKSAWGRAFVPTSAIRVGASIVVVVPRIDMTGAHDGDAGSPAHLNISLLFLEFSQL